MGFGAPIGQWFRGDLRDLARDVVLGRRARERGYFQPATVERLVEEHLRGVREWHYQLWNLLMLELWHQTYVDARGSVPVGSAPGPEPGVPGSRRDVPAVHV